MTSTGGELDLHGLRSRCAGPVTGPGDATWDQARMAWNVAVDQRPAVVAQATDYYQRELSGAATVGRASCVTAYFAGSLTKATLLRPAFEASARVSAT